MNEQFYKTLCEKYIKTMNKEMLLEIDNKIVHIFIEDDYIDLKYEGKINKDNYKNYLDSDFSEYQYDTYKELFDIVVKDEIAYDMKDLDVFDLEGIWDFYLTFEEIREIGFGNIVKDNYPLIQEYAISEENISDFFNHFTLEQLNDFEESLHLYFKTNEIKYDQELGFISSENYSFNVDILRLACGLVSYEDFISDFTIKIPTNESVVISEIIKYFNENNIENLEQYGADGDEGLFKLSSLYSNILNNLKIPYFNVLTENSYAGGNKYITTISIDNDTNISVETRARDGIEQVTKNLTFILDEKNKSNEKQQMKNDDIENEINL